MNLLVRVHLNHPQLFEWGNVQLHRRMQLGLHEAYELTSATMADNCTLDPGATEGIDAFFVET